MSKKNFKPIQFFLLVFIFLSGHFNLFSQSPGYTANDQVTPYAGPFHFGSNPGYYPGWTDGQIGDLAAGNLSLGIPGIGATSLRPGLFEFYLEQYGYDVNLPWFEHYDSLGLKDNTLFVGYPSADHRDPSFHCATSQSTVFRNMYLPIWDNGENGTPVNDDNYYALFLYKMVTDYQPYVKFWEIWNEPDLDFSAQGMGWREPGDPNGSWWDSNPEPCDIQLAAPIFHYNRLLRISYEVIKSIDPDAYVTVGGLGFPSFLDALMRNTDNPIDGSVTAEYPLKAGAYFDVLSFHSYPHINGSLLIWDPINGITGYKRHSDAAIAGITEDLNEFKAVMNTYGYDGTVYPEKEVIMTESSIPRKKFGDYIGSEEAARNYAMKLPIELQKEEVLQFHFYDLGEKENLSTAIYPFQTTGFYEKLEGTPLSDIQRTQSGIAYKTTSDALFEKTYDANQTALLNLPVEVDGAAFRDNNNAFTYILWAVCQTDDTEESTATYSFPASLNLVNLETKAWDYEVTGEQTIVSAQNVALTGAPLFFTPSNQEISFTCPANIEIEVPSGETGETISWNTPIATTLCNNTLTTVTQTSGLANGSFFPIGTTTIGYQISDNCGNVETCSFNVIISEAPTTTPPITCDNNEKKVTITVIGNGSVEVQFIDPSGTTQICTEGVCTYCVNNNSLIKLVGLPNTGETFLGWSNGGCSGTNDCWKSINWETEITATFSSNQVNNVNVDATASDASCNGATDGSVSLNVSGGTPSYAYSWSSGETTPQLQNVAAGTYVVTVTDSNGISATASATVTQPTALMGLINNSTDVTCVGADDGSATAVATGGTSPYSFLWSNNLPPGQAGNTLASIENLPAGDYTVTVTDAQNCTTSATVNILESNSSSPMADFSKEIETLDVSFTDISTGNPTDWAWDFGDGNAAIGSTATHSYDTAGVYLVCLSASNDCGLDIVCQDISVGQTNNVSIELGSATGNLGEMVQIPVRVTDFENVVSFQHSFMIPDTNLAVFVGTSNFLTNQLGNAATINVNAQTVNTVWLTANGDPISIIDGTALYYLDILLKGSPAECVDIVINDQNFPTEFVVIETGNIVQLGFDFTAGEVCTTPGIDVSGNIQTEDGTVVRNVEVWNNDSLETTTNLIGEYVLPSAVVGSSFLIEPHKNVNHVNGVTSFDLATIQQHIVGNILLDSPYKIIAADIDASDMVTSFDLFLAQQVIVAAADTFPNNESWRFIPSDFVFPNPANPFETDFPESIELTNLDSNLTEQNFVAVKVGDVNATALTNFDGDGISTLARSAQGETEFLFQPKQVNEEEFYVEFSAAEVQDLIALQFDFFFEKSKMEFQRVEGSALKINYGNTLLQEGVLTFIWFDQQGTGQTFETDSELFRIYFKGKLANIGQEDFSVVQHITPPIAYDIQGNASQIKLSPRSEVKAAENSRSSIVVYQNIPNPFSQKSKIKFKMNIDDLVQVSIANQHGSIIYDAQKMYRKGIHEIVFDASDFPATGLYYYSFTTSTDKVVKKMIVQH